MPTGYVALLLATMALLLPDADLFAGKLDRVRNQTRTESSGSGSSSSSGSSKHSSHSHRSCNHHYDCDCDDDDGLSGMFGAALLAGVSAPFWAPPAMLGDEGDPGYFPDHPYDDAAGSLLFDKEPSGAHDTQIILQGQYGDDLGGVSHANGRLIIDTAWRFGIDTEFFYRHEDGVADDELWTGDFNFIWRFAQSEPLQFRTGIGFNWLADRVDDDYGFNFTYGADLFPGDPWVLSGTIDWGRIGEATLFHGRTTIGVTQNGFGVFTGYDYFNVGGAGLHAWITGVELRF